jgi:glucan 1,3-beta-glucosidase
MLSFPRVLVYLLSILGVVWALPSHDDGTGLYMWHQRRAMAKSPRYLSPRALNISSSALQQAQDLVAAAVAKQSAYNAYRVANPQRNTYRSRHSGAASRKRSDDPGPEAPHLDDSLKAAAALLAESHARQQESNGTLHKSYHQFQDGPRPLTVAKRAPAADPFAYWPSLVDHGVPSMGFDPSYPVYRDVKDPKFGAKGDGVTDDTAAINRAIAYGNSCLAGCNSSTTKGTFIYFPPGTYLISSPINASYYSQLVGNYNDLPIIKTAPNFIGLGAIQTDVYIPDDNGNEWYIEQSNFYRQVRNLIIDIEDTTTAKVAALHWQVAQATSLTNVYISASLASDTTQMGLYTENGSGGFMSDCTIVGGAYGIYGGNQQYTVRNFQIFSQTEANICLLWDWGWTWAGMYLAKAPVGISLISPEADTRGQEAGSIYLLDSQFVQTPTAIKASFQSKSMLNTSIITLDNIMLTNVGTAVGFVDGSTLDIRGDKLDFIIVGNVDYLSHMSQGYFQYAIQRAPPALQDPKATPLYHAQYFYKTRPQYQTLGVGSIVSVKDHGAKGDGVTDDTAAIVAALALATKDNLIYFPPGSYIVTSTIVIPAHARLTGQVWSQIVASGSYFANMASPKPMLQVGKAGGEVGTIEISDLLFTSIGNLPGLVLMQWNVQAEKQGSVGIWDSHFRIGGAYGTKLQVAQCPASAPLNGASCVAASTIMHMTPGSNGYFENMWLWVADHDIDDPANTRVSIAVARGLLLDSTSGPTWMFGTASEHSMLYQYNFKNATNTLAGMIQTEAPYFQAAGGIANSPGPFMNLSMGLFAGDPWFPDTTCVGPRALCDFSWAVTMQQNTNLTIAGAGLYSWFDNYIETCVDTQNCQQRLVLDSGGNSGTFVFNLVTIGAVEMISNVDKADVVLAKNNTQAFGHPFWSALAAYTDDQSQKGMACTDDDTHPACQVAWNCDLTQSYSDVDSLNGALSYPNQCMPYYAVDTLATILNDSMTSYTDANKDYDKYFGYYQEYIKEMVPEAINAFMADSTPSQPQGGPGNKYFDCTCEGYGPTSTQQCPFTYKQIMGANEFVMTYKLKDSDGFFAELQQTYGIQKSWVVFKNTGGRQGGSIGHCSHDLCAEPTNFRYVNKPQAADSGSINPSNPKDIVTKATPAINGMLDNIITTYLDMVVDNYNGSLQDVPDTYSMPVFLIQQAVTSMAKVKSLGEEQAKKDKVKLILEILGIVFAFLPFVDEFAPALEVLDGVFATIAVAGNIALDIQGIIADPTSAPMILLDLVGGRGGSTLREGKDFEKAAAAAKTLKDSDLSAIGADFKVKQTKFRDETAPKCAV